MFSILSRRCPLLATSCPSFFCLLSMLISDSRFDLVWFRLSCDHGWIRSGSVNVRKQQQQQHTSLRGGPLLVGEQQKWYQQILQKVQNLVPHDYIKSCTVHTVVEQYVLVDYLVLLFSSNFWCKYSSRSLYYSPKHMRRFFLSQSTLREEFVEKKYQVFDMVGSLIIVVQVNLSSPVERV